jgi:hypothetical protein
VEVCSVNWIGDGVSGTDAVRGWSQTAESLVQAALRLGGGGWTRTNDLRIMRTRQGVVAL